MRPAALRPLALLFLLVATTAAPAALAPAAGREAAGEKAALAWLKLMDAGRYGDAWQESAEVFRHSVTSAAFADRLRSARSPLGVAMSRTVTSRTLTAQLPGAPEGEYLVLLLATDFAAKKKAVETVTFRLERDGHWRAAGYYIR